MPEKGSWKGRPVLAWAEAGHELPVGLGGREREPERDEHHCDRRERTRACVQGARGEEMVMGMRKEGDVGGDRE